MRESDSKNREYLIQEFRDLISDFMPELKGFRQSDWYLWTFLKEHHLNVEKAGEAIRSATKWKAKLNITLLKNSETRLMMDRFPYDNKGFDKNGHPILVVPFGKWGIREAIERGEKEIFLRHAIQMTEINQDRLVNAIESSNGIVQGVIIIFDLKDYSIRQLMDRQTISTLSEWTRRGEQLYPQQLKSFYVVNANWMMPILYNLLKPFMSRNTVDRVRIFDSDQSKWQKVLFETIAQDQLSPEYGGTK